MKKKISITNLDDLPNIDNEMHDLIIQEIKKLKFTTSDLFGVRWEKMSAEEKTLFLEKVSELYMKKGITVNDVCIKITNEFEENGLITGKTIRKYIDEKFKDYNQANKRKGKYFKTIGKEKLIQIEEPRSKSAI